ncbi:transcriptional regulator [Desulfosporosinus orientis DSM 765]|uniref:Transcriptional regulator n=1 Tax=Desulfosporosinus orientis (strain ATCC 19365 / DSM 765 / NCIMB 8382 / VKM B-1628 / Singapore I) TaxID=768706 RepID=G7WAS8_DESOD|nr:GntR family transcriptional regulator [Desulfosporosinus orientis]AET67139.1 transcriptional regulator [Desulfosporosinus orientis DSM 765]
MFNTTSLREQVYNYLCHEIKKGNLRPGSFIHLDVLSKKLQISKTPLKEAILKLECEGFVEILPRRGIVVKKLTNQEIKDLYEIIGSLESSVILSVFDQITNDDIQQMKAYNQELLAALDEEEFDKYYQLNLDFHECFLKLSPNMTLRRYISPAKQRLYDFTKRQYVKEWELISLEEHSKFIRCIENGDREDAARVIKEEHWGWTIHEAHAVLYYELDRPVDEPANG